MDRLDKILANLGYGTRKEIKQLIKNKEVQINGIAVNDSAIKLNPENDEIKIHGQAVMYRKNIYIMMNKPAGVVSATFDNFDKTVIDLLEHQYLSFNPFPVGRLDKDTVGLLLITNDGDLNHKLISPRWHVNKVYYAEIDKLVDSDDVEAFKNGIVLDDGYTCMPAKLEIDSSESNGAKIHVTIQEGKFHQVKRMFEARNKTVTYLKRISFGPIILDETLPEGEYRELRENEIEMLKHTEA